MELAKGSLEIPPEEGYPSLQKRYEKTNKIVIFSVPLSVCLGLQYLLPGLQSLLHWPLSIFSSLCLFPDDLAQGQLLAKVFFLSGISTAVQSLFGARSPVMVTPSVLFVSTAIETFKTSYWEKNTKGDLYAMGPNLRNELLQGRAGELQGLLMASSIGFAALFLVLWYCRIKLSSATISATLVSSSILHIYQLMPDVNSLGNRKSSLALLIFCLLLFFSCVQGIKVPCMKVTASEDNKIKLRFFKVFGVILAFIICVTINVYLELDTDDLFERTTKSLSWLSFDFFPTDFNIPAMSLRAWLLFPALLSQLLTSYCCYSFINQRDGRQIKAILCECCINALIPLLGMFLPLSMDLGSLGLWCFTDIQNNETTVISGSLLLVVSAFLPVIALFSFVPYTLVYGMNAFCYGLIIFNAITEGRKNMEVDLKIISTSVFIGMMIPQLIPKIHEESYFNILVVFMKNPVILTFCISLLLHLTYKSPKNNDVKTKKFSFIRNCSSNVNEHI